MKKILILLAAFSVLWMTPGTTRAQDTTPATNIQVSDAYSFSVPEGARSAALFLTITYPETLASGDVTDRMMSIETPVAEKAEIHTTIIENDVMMMRRLDALPLPPTGKLTLAPGGAHIMLLNMKQALNTGETFPLTLNFEKAGTIAVDAMVRAPGDMPEHDESSGHGSH